MIRKAISLLCVCVMVMAMAVPALAATQGQVDDLADQVTKNPSNAAAAKQLADAVKNDKGFVVDENVSNAMREALLASNGNRPNVETTVDGCKVAAYHSPGMDQQLEISKVLFKDGTLEFTAQFEGGVQSELGVYVEVEINGDVDETKTYMWECDGQTGKAFVKKVGTGDNVRTVLSFYAPHFSTYIITAVNSSAPAPAPAPAPSVLANTASDMSFAILGVVALGALAVLGSAVALKKRGAEN